MNIKSTQLVLDEVLLERKRQHDKFGEQNHSPFAWLPILMEEVGEASRETVDFQFALKLESLDAGDRYDTQLERLKNYRKEMIQVAAVAVQAIECLDRSEALLGNNVHIIKQ